MQKQLSYYLLAIIFILNSCSNEEYNYSVNTILPKTLKTIYPDYPKDNFSTDFIYDGNKIVSIRNKNEKRNYEYEGNNIVKETVYSLYKGEETKYAETNYSYKNDSLKTVTTLLNGEKIRYDYSYNNNGSINKEVYNLDNNTGKESKKSEKDLITIINGNIANSESDWGDNYDVISTIKYEYDTNNNAFKNIRGLNLLLDQFSLDSEMSLSSNNNIKRYIVSHKQGPLSNIVFEPYSLKMEYEYNKNGYPIKKTTYDYTGQIIEINEFIY